MGPLITIETVPISIEFVEKKSNHSADQQSAKLQFSKQDDWLTIKSNPINIQLRDTFEQTASKNWSNISYTATARYSNNGNIKMNVKMGDGNSSDYSFKRFERGIDNIIEFIPKAPAASPRHFESMDIDFDMSHLSIGSQNTNNMDTSFMPPDLELKVLEMPKVIIKYVGGPIYIPRSSDPNYEAPENTNPLFDGVKFEAKA